MRLKVHRVFIAVCGIILATLGVFYYLRTYPTSLTGTWANRDLARGSDTAKTDKVLTLRPGGHGYLKFVGLPITEQEVSWAADGDKVKVSFNDSRMPTMLGMNSPEVIVTRSPSDTELIMDIDGDTCIMYREK